MRDAVVDAIKDKLILRNIFPKKWHGDTEDSEMTVVSLDNITRSPIQTWHSDSAPLDSVLIDHFLCAYAHSSFAPTWFDQFIPPFNGLQDSEAEWKISESQKRNNALTSSSKIALNLPRRKESWMRKLWSSSRGGSGEKSLSTSWINAWLKRMVIPCPLSTQTRDYVRHWREKLHRWPWKSNACKPLQLLGSDVINRRCS